MQKIKLTLEYDGTDFAGWQIQPGERTVQGEIETALEIMLKTGIRITGSGRTDAGVHAIGQVAHFTTPSELAVNVYKKALNTLLPKDVRVVGSMGVKSAFHARYDAIRRKYRYIIAKQQHAIGRHYSWFPEKQSPFDIMKMKNSSRFLVGEHDFTSFSKNGDAKGSCASIVYDIHWHESDTEIIFEIEAIRFFHNMIRIIIGTLIEVGCGRMSEAEFRALLTQHDRTKAGLTAPPHGLFLVSVLYKEE